MTLHYDLYWSFRSPYSYLATSRLLALEQAYDVWCNVRPVYPLAVRTPEFFEGRDPPWFSYLMMDIAREAAFVGLPLRWPRPDPVHMDRATRTYPADQPHIHRLTHMGVAAAEMGRGLPFLAEVSRLIWSGEVDGWNEGDHLRRAAERAGLDADTLLTTVEDDAERLRLVVETSQTDQRAAGHYGVPMMVFGGEPFFGQDRIDQLKWRMAAAGLARRDVQTAGAKPRRRLGSLADIAVIPDDFDAPLPDDVLDAFEGH